MTNFILRPERVTCVLAVCPNESFTVPLKELGPVRVYRADPVVLMNRGQLALNCQFPAMLNPPCVGWGVDTSG